MDRSSFSKEVMFQGREILNWDRLVQGRDFFFRRIFVFMFDVIEISKQWLFFSKYWEDVYACNRKFSRVVARVERRGD